MTDHDAIRILSGPGGPQQAETPDRENAFEANLLNAIEQAVIATDLEGRVVFWNPHAECLYGWSREEALGKTVMELKAAPHPEDHCQAQEILEALQRGESWSGVINLQRKDGTTFPAYVTDSPVRDGQGRFIGIVGVSRDRSDRHEAERHRELLVKELQHRFKNTLSVVQSMAAQSFRADCPLAAARAEFDARLKALARAHDLMISDGWRTVAARDLFGSALSPFLESREARVETSGPDLELPAQVAFALALALHELATNAVKYGSLCVPEGKVLVRWDHAVRVGKPWLQVEWRETGGPPVAPPTRHGFGSRLIEKGLRSELREVDLVYESSGVVCTILAPLGA